MRILPLALLAGTLLSGVPAMAADIDWSKVDQALGKTGTAQPGNVHKYAAPICTSRLTASRSSPRWR
jgi:hypothetical protein